MENIVNIRVIQENDNIVGFCKCDTDVESKQGKLDYLMFYHHTEAKDMAECLWIGQ